MENNIELQEMREQLDSFKKQLAGQKIINEKLMRKAMAEKVSKLHGKRNSTLILGTVAILLTTTIFSLYGFPLVFIVYGDAMVLFSMTMTIIDKADFMNSNLKTAITELKRLRQRYIQWIWVAIPMIIIYMILLWHSCLQMNYDQEYFRTLMIYCTIGGAIGFIIGVRLNRNFVRLCNEIIKDLENN